VRAFALITADAPGEAVELYVREQDALDAVGHVRHPPPVARFARH
jgi:hypothetical protein